MIGRGTRPPILLILLLFTTPACSTGREGEIACQERMVEASSRSPFTGEAARLLDEMSLEGCSEDQAARARVTARAASALANAFERVNGVPPTSATGAVELQRALETDPELSRSEHFLELMDQLERWERRRAALRSELEELSASR